MISDDITILLKYLCRFLRWSRGVDQGWSAWVWWLWWLKVFCLKDDLRWLFINK